MKDMAQVHNLSGVVDEHYEVRIIVCNENNFLTTNTQIKYLILD